jgi:hypothetical protein
VPDLTDERLAAVLASVADHLVVAPAAATATPATHGADADAAGTFPPNGSEDDAGDRGPDHGGRRAGALAGRGGWRGRVLVAAVVLVVATIGSLVVAPVREAVAGWLGIGSTEIERVPLGEGDPGDLPYLGDDLDPVSRRVAEARLGVPLPDTDDTDGTDGPELGPAPVLAIPSEGGVIMAWSDGATTLWVQRTAQPADQAIEKLLTMDDGFERVDDLGDDAAVVEGPHILLTPERRLAAGTVVIWVDHDLEYRLESDLGVDEMLAVARGIRRG